MTAASGTLIWTDTQKLTIRDLVRYAGASGDFNPIHYDVDFAKSRGLPNIIVHGMFGTGIIARLVRAHAAGPVQFDRIAARFLGVLVPDREITFSCYEADDSGPPRRRLTVDVRHTGAENPSVICQVQVTETSLLTRSLGERTI
jgi:acyl dehydratase